MPSPQGLRRRNPCPPRISDFPLTNFCRCGAWYRRSPGLVQPLGLGPVISSASLRCVFQRAFNYPPFPRNVCHERLCQITSSSAAFLCQAPRLPKQPQFRPMEVPRAENAPRKKKKKVRKDFRDFIHLRFRNFGFAKYYT